MKNQRNVKVPGFNRLLNRTEAKYFTNGKCYKCGREKLSTRKICDTCCDYSKRRNSKLKALGICFLCGQYPRHQKNTYCKSCWEKQQIHTKAWRNKIIQEVINKYGGKCACCGETEFVFLTLDHMNNDGHLERKERGYRGGYKFYKILRDIPIRKDLQVSCYNCNLGRTRCGGICPHKWEKRS